MIEHSIDRTGTWPIDLATAKTYLKMDGIDTDDAIITDMIELVCVYAESFTGRQLNTEASVVSTYSREDCIRLLWDNSEISVSEIVYIDYEGDELTVDYWKDRNVLRINNGFFPDGYFKVTYSSTPGDLKGIETSLLKLIGDAYYHRVEEKTNVQGVIEMNARVYLSQFQNAGGWM